MTSLPSLPAPVHALIDQRYSCRTYLERAISDEEKARLQEFMATRTEGPLGSQARFRLLAAAADDRTALRRLGTYGFVKGATGYIAGAVRRAPNDLEDLGFLLEEIVLLATSLGLGTCWLGGTFTRSTFVRRFGGLEGGETMPAVVATGHVGDDGTERIRQRQQGERRLHRDELFFDGEFGRPLGAPRIDGSASADDCARADGHARADGYARALEAVRMAPSATNRQPWRIVRGGGDGRDGGGDWHFFMQRTKGYGGTAFRLLRIADLQRVDLGIAMCHFALVARESGHRGRWVIDDPGIALPEGAEYVVTWRGVPHKDR